MGFLNKPCRGNDNLSFIPTKAAVEKRTKPIIPSEALAESRDLADIDPKIPILNILWTNI